MILFTLEVLTFFFFFNQHGKIISREELEEILAKEKNEELEVFILQHLAYWFLHEYTSFI